MLQESVYRPIVIVPCPFAALSPDLYRLIVGEDCLLLWDLSALKSVLNTLRDMYGSISGLERLSQAVQDLSAGVPVVVGHGHGGSCHLSYHRLWYKPPALWDGWADEDNAVCAVLRRPAGFVEVLRPYQEDGRVAHLVAFFKSAPDGWWSLKPFAQRD